jgi:predicted transcriptional regulator
VRDTEDQQETRKKQVVDFVRLHPGAHLREIKRDLMLSMGVTQYHLYRLEKERTIVSRRRGLYKRYYANLIFQEEDRDILDILSHETQREVLLFILQKSSASQKDLVVFTKLSITTVNWHLKQLLSAGLIDIRTDGPILKYQIKVSKEQILKLLETYHPSIMQKWADRFSDIIIDLSGSKIGETRT